MESGSHRHSEREIRRAASFGCALHSLPIGMETIRRENPRIRIVFARTRQAYGKPHKLPVSQDHPLDPADVNAIHTVAYYRRRLSSYL